MRLTIYILSGIPGSGKTTMAKQLAEQHNAVILSYDDMPRANTKASMDGSVMEAWFDTIHDTLQSGKSVVCDGLFLTSDERKRLLSAIADIQCGKVLVYKDVPVEVCLQRNRQRKARLPDFVITQSAEKLEQPQPDEGWDEILVYKE